MRLSRYQFGEFELDPASRELSRSGERIGLPPKSFECLAYLLAHRERAVGRDELIAAVWGRVEVSDTVVAQTLLRARKALNDTGDRQAIVRTVPRFGYRWVAPVQECSVQDAVEPSEAAAPPSPPSSIDVGNDGVPIDAPPSSKRRQRAPAWVLALVLLTSIAAGWMLLRVRPVAHAGADAFVLVLPVMVAPADGENAWVRLGAMEYIANRLRRSGLKVLPSEQTLHLSAQVGERADADALRNLQATSGARWILVPEAERDRVGWRMRLRLLDVAGLHVIETRGSTALTAAAAVTDSWLRRTSQRIADEGSRPSPLVERLQQIDAELLAGQLGAARRLVDSASRTDRDDARLRVRAAQIEFRAGHINAASDLFRQLLDRPALADDLRAKVLMGQGAVEIRRGDFPAAEASYTQALALLEAMPPAVVDAAELGNAYNGRGVARVQQHRMEAAVHDMGVARIAMQRSGNLIEAAGVGANLGQIETQRGHYAQALQEFDAAIAVFERFDVRDYAAAGWMGKADTQLELVQPLGATASIQRASELAKTLEDAYLTSDIEFVKARALLETGRLRDAERSMARLTSLGIPESNPRWQELNLRVALSLDVRRAGVLARRYLPAADAVPGALALPAVQAALLNHRADVAQAWLSRAPTRPGRTHVAWCVARALVAQSERRGDGALQLARQAMDIAERTGNPSDRVRTGVLLARILLAQGRHEEAASVLGDLDAFVALDYRVAWTTLALYRDIGDQGMVLAALKQVQALRGERDITVEPVL